MNMSNMEWYIVAGVVIGSVFVVILGLFALVKAFYIKVPQGTALIINDTTSQPKVKFTGGLVLPVIHKKEFMQISLLTLEIDRRGKEGLICRDNMRADITVAFYLRVNETAEDVLKVAKAIGVDRASDKTAVNELFNAKFSEALKTVGKQIEFVKLFENRQDFRDQIIHVIGNDLNGYVLEDVAIDYLEQTPKSSLDPNNILDAEGIRKITELTANQNIVTNELERNSDLAITKKNVETKEAMLALERQQADAEARQKREIATIQAREQAETQKVQEEERLKAEQARLEQQPGQRADRMLHAVRMVAAVEQHPVVQRVHLQQAQHGDQPVQQHEQQQGAKDESRKAKRVLQERRHVFPLPSNPAAEAAGLAVPAWTTAAHQAFFPPVAARCAFRRSSTDCALPAWGVMPAARSLASSASSLLSRASSAALSMRAPRSACFCLMRSRESSALCTRVCEPA